jgi:putative methionine-R-sulfoxide reductase with GAF domain
MFVVKESDPFAKWAKQQKVPLLVENLDNDYRFSKNIAKTSQFKSIIVVPLWIDHKLYSFLEIKSKIENAFREEDLRMLIIISDIVSLDN